MRIFTAYFEAGADIVETNTFNANSVSMAADYGLQDYVFEINREAARLAREVAEEFTRLTPEKPRFVAGSIGPTTKTASVGIRPEDPSYRGVSFDELVASYTESVHGLVTGGVDILFPETAIDTLNLKACLFAIENYFDQHQIRLPVMISITVPGKDGRTLSGQTPEAAWVSVSQFDMLSVGINCALGPEPMRPHVEALAQASPAFVSCHPNAGLPNEFGEYDESPKAMAQTIREFAEAGWLNIVGGCCGSTPEHIKAIADAVEHITPRQRPVLPHYSRLSGLEPLTIRPETNFIMIGERTNITGSKICPPDQGWSVRRGRCRRSRPGGGRRKYHRREHGRRID